MAARSLVAGLNRWSSVVSHLTTNRKPSWILDGTQPGVGHGSSVANGATGSTEVSSYRTKSPKCRWSSSHGSPQLTPGEDTRSSRTSACTSTFSLQDSTMSLPEQSSAWPGCTTTVPPAQDSQVTSS